MSFPLAELWLSATADLCKQVHVPVMRGRMNLCSQWLFLITAVHQSPVGPGTYRKEQKAPADAKQAEFRSFSQAFS